MYDSILILHRIKESPFIIVDWTLRIISIGAIFVSLYLLSQGKFEVFDLGFVSSVTLGSVGALYLLSDYAFSRGGGIGRVDAMIFAILFCGSFVWTYELIYHFSFPLSFPPNYPIIIDAGEVARYLALTTLPILPMVLVRKKLTFTHSSAILVGIFAAMWLSWILFGFPQYVQKPDWFVYVPPILKTTNPSATSLFFNFGTKAILAFVYASILNLPYREAVSKFIHRSWVNF